MRRELERLTRRDPARRARDPVGRLLRDAGHRGRARVDGGGDGAWERFAGPVGRLTRLIPEEVLVGYHLCYGTFPEWPMYEARDMGLMVRMANYAVADSGRAGRLAAPRRAPLPAQRGQALLRAAGRPGHPGHARLPRHRAAAGRHPGPAAPARDGVAGTWTSSASRCTAGSAGSPARTAARRCAAPRDRPRDARAEVGASKLGLIRIDKATRADPPCVRPGPRAERRRGQLEATWPPTDRSRLPHKASLPRAFTLIHERCRRRRTGPREQPFFALSNRPR